MSDRLQMIGVLKETVVPKLRNLKFKGSFPHFRRYNQDCINLITFQFDNWGGGFVVELANCSTEGVIMHWGEKISANKVTAHHVDKRYRLGSKGANSDHWFRYDKDLEKDRFSKSANEVMKFLDAVDYCFSKLLKK